MGKAGDFNPVDIALVVAGALVGKVPEVGKYEQSRMHWARSVKGELLSVQVPIISLQYAPHSVPHTPPPVGPACLQWALFVPLQSINFTLVPPHFRNPLLITAGFFWVMGLSFFRGDKEREEAGQQQIQIQAKPAAGGGSPG